MSDNKQSTETYTVKLDSKVKEELQGLIKEYNDQGTQGDFIRLLVETFKTNKLSNAIVDTKADLRELNSLTTRIYNLYSNLIERNSSNMEGLKADINEKIQNKDDIIAELKENIEELKLNNSIKADKIKETNEFAEGLLGELTQLRDRTAKDTMLIDKLSQEVEEIKELKIQNNDMRKEIKKMEESLNFMSNINKELQDTIKLNDDDISRMNEELEKVILEYKQKLEEKELKHEEETDSLKQSLEAECMKQILKLKEEHQKEIKDLQDKSFEEKEKLQDKYSERMDKYEQEKEELQRQIEELKNI